MRIRSSKNQPENPTPVDKLMGYTQNSYHSFMDYVALRDDDPIWMLSYKLLLRFIGIVFFTAISPFVIIGFLLAIMVAL
jgi:hypothetical protein